MMKLGAQLFNLSPPIFQVMINLGFQGKDPMIPQMNTAQSSMIRKRYHIGRSFLLMFSRDLLAMLLIQKTFAGS